MEAQELFRRLGAGARFDVRRFGLDARRFGVIRGSGGPPENLDFFGSKERASLGSVGKQEDGAGRKDVEMAGKRKRTAESGKRKRKKRQETVSVPELSESDGIMWMSSLEAKVKDTKDNKKPTAEKLERLRREKINRFRNQHRINVQGTDLPDPIATFDQLQKEYKVHPKVIENIQAAGFQVPTPIQMQAIPVMLHGRELLASAPTGSGKTLAFCIPLLTHLKQPMNKGFRALIISPTRELASQTHRELVKLADGTGFRIHMIQKASEAAKKFGPKSSRKFDILVTTPNRLIYLLKQDPPAIDLTSVEWLVVDESDKLFEDGKSGFRDQLASIFLACTSHVVRRAFFSATFAHDVEEWCKLNLDSIVLVSVGARNSAAETVEQELLFVGSETGKLTAMRELVKKGFAPPVLVFVQSIERAKELFHELIYEGINVDVIHADKTQQQRDNVVHSFRAGKIWVLICTALLARGIDFKGVNMVINYDLPTSAVEYIHRIGRTGRAGHTGKAVTFFTEDDKPLLRSIANVIQRAGCPVPDYIKHFPKLQSKQKKKFIKKPLTREAICTTPQCFLKKDRRKNFMFPVAGTLGPPQGMIPMQQQGFPMVPVMQSNMPGMMGMNYGSQIPPGPMAMQGGMPLGPMPATGMPYMGQASFIGMRPAAAQYTPDMQKQFAEEQQKRFEHQQKFLEEERKRRQFEEQKQKLRLLSSVKPKTGEKSRDDALEAIKGNLDGFSRDAKMHPTPASHPKKPDHSTSSSHSAVSVSHSSFLDDEEFSDFIQGPTESPKVVPQSTSQPFQPFHSATGAGQLLSEKAVVQPLPPAQTPVLSILHGTAGHVPYFPTSASSLNIHKTGSSLEEKVLDNGSNESEQEQTKLKTSEVGHKASAPGQAHPSLAINDWALVGGHESGTTAAEVHKASEQNIAIEECGVGVFPSQDPIQQMMPPWIYNDSLVPELYKKILETTLTPAGIDTAKLYPILMSSGLPRETLGQIWALANRTTPGKLTKEELYAVLAMIAVTQRGIPAVSPDMLNQFPAAPVPTLSGFPMPLPAAVSQQPLLPTGPPVSMPLSIGPPVMGMGITAAAPAGGAAAPPAGAFVPSYPPSQVVKPEDDDFQEFQDASKSGSLDDSFTDFQGDGAGSSKAASSQHRSSVPSLLMPLPGNKTLSSTDKYAVFKGIAADKPESTATFADSGDKYSAFRELEQPSESKYGGDNLAEFKAAGTDDGFTDFKTADSISPLEPPTKDKTFPTSFPSLPVQSKQQTQAKTSLNLADLDLFSSTGENKQLSFPPAFNASKPSSFPPPPSTTAQPAPSKSSSLADEFGEFNLFGEFSNSASASGQDDFADFMAFNNSSGFSEQKPDDKYNALKAETSPVPQPGSSASTGRSAQNSATAATPTKYDIFKQLSLEGSGAGFEETKDSTLSSVKSDDDFADFHSNKFSSTCNSTDKSLVDKVAAFKQAKEDSASVKSLDLPSIGGSSVGKEDSEDALSVQFDMKLTDVEGDLKHVMSDSSLDLPTVSGQHPPAADIDELKCAPFGSYNSGSAVSSLASYDWSDKDDIHQGKKFSFAQASGSGSSAATSVLQKKETLFGSSENITMTTVSKVTTFSSEDALQDVSFAAFANFKDSGPISSGPSDDDNGDFGDFARPSSEARDAAADPNQEADFLTGGISSEVQRESTDDFGEFQSEKPKISKFDFLVATSQGKVKSSEEMIKSELATFDLSVQGSHKRSLSLGDREISRSSPLSALEQPFRDRSNTLSEKPALPVIRDKYKDLTGEVEESERYAYEWQRCLESALQVIKKANDTLNGISSSSVCTEVIQSAQGMEYLLGVVEVYRVTKRVELGIKATAVCSEKLQQLLKDIDKVWNNLISFMSLAALTPDENSLDFSSCMLRPGIKNAQDLACGVCLLNVDSRSKAFNSETDNFKLAYGGHQYHASCANFWINCVEPKPPGLILPDLL